MFKWYGDMTGSMVMTTPSLAKDGQNLDGFASLDANAGNATVIVGGVSDGTIQIVIKGCKSAPFFGNKVHVVVEHTRWAGRSGVVTSTDTLSTADLTIASDQVTVTISNVNGDDGYRLSLTPAGSASDGGVPGDAGSDGGTVNRDAKEAGSGGAGGTSGSGGQPGAGSDGGVDAGAGAGGSASLGSGGSSTGGTTGGGSGGAMGSGGTSNAGGAESGTPADAGTTGRSGGVESSTAGGTSTRQGGGASGCSCAIQGSGQAGARGLWLLLALVVVFHNPVVRANRQRWTGACAQKSQSDPSSRKSSPLPPA